MLTNEQNSTSDNPTRPMSPTSDMSHVSDEDAVTTSDTSQPDTTTGDMSGVSERYLSVPEFARRVGRSERTVQRWVRRGSVSATMLGGGARIPESEVDRVDPTSDTDTMSPTSDVSDSRSRRQATTSDTSRHPVAYRELLERHESAMVRLGWLENELQTTRRALTDGSAQVSAVESKLQAEAEARRQAELQAAVAEEARRRADAAEGRERVALAQLAETQAQLLQFQTDLARAQTLELESQQKRPWWRRMFAQSQRA